MAKQISVFLENRTGRLNHLLEVLSDNKINIHAISIAETGEYGLVRLIVSDHDRAYAAIRQSGMMASDNDVMILDVSDTAGALYAATKLLADNDINVEYIYNATSPGNDRALVIVKVNDLPRASRVFDAESAIRVCHEFE